ncbi:hypothetical protein NKH77_01010 [Streptomyces sp. M19]
MRLIHHIVQRKQFRLGPSSHYPVELALRDMLPFVRRGAPIVTVLPFFPNKFADSGLKAAAPARPGGDRDVHPHPGDSRDGPARPSAGHRLPTRHGRPPLPRPPRASIAEGMAVMGRYAEAAGVLGTAVTITDFDELARRHNGDAFVRAHHAERARILKEYRAAMRASTSRRRRCGSCAPCRPATRAATSPSCSVRWCSPCPRPGRGRPAAGGGAGLRRPVQPGRGLCAAGGDRGAQEVLRTAWEDTLQYVATWHADAEVGYRARLCPGAVPASMRPRPGMLGLNLLGGPPSCAGTRPAPSTPGAWCPATSPWRCGTRASSGVLAAARRASADRHGPDDGDPGGGGRQRRAHRPGFVRSVRLRRR